MRHGLILFLFVCGILQTNSLSAQQTNSKTLLWRISGNGLQQPSYLYGTMHLKDRRLFFFGDSVYNAIENTQGFAMELDPQDMMDSLFSRLSDTDTTSLLRKVLDKRKYDSLSKKLEQALGIPADKITRKKLLKERDTWYTKYKKKDDMKTVVDMYLYDIASKQGKWVGGIEDVNDQLDMKDELGNEIDIEDFVNTTEKERKNYMEEMIKIYVDQDIARMDQR